MTRVGVRRSLLVALCVWLAVGYTATGDVAADTTPTPLPHPGRTEVSGTRWTGRIVVAGGIVEAPSGFAPSRDLFIFDPATAEWTRGPDLPGPRDHAALASLGGRLYLVGGYTGGLTGATREVWRLESPTATWTRVADLGTARGALAVAVARGHLVAVGGTNPGGVLRSTEWYDPDADEWRDGPELAAPREHLGAAAAGGRIYAIGGRNPGNLASVESLAIGRDGPRSAWRDEPDLVFSRGGNGAATVAGRPCTAGGEETAGTIAPIECLGRDRWEQVGTLRLARHGLAVVGRGRSLHVIAGGPQPGATFSTTHEIFEVGRAR